MKARNLIPLLCLALPLAAGSTGCGTSAQPAADEPTAQTSQKQVIDATGSIFAWPAGPIAWNGLVGTWPIAVWSPVTIGAVAFDIAGMTNLGMTLTGFSNLAAVPITTAYLNAFVPLAAVPIAAAAPFLTPAGFGFAGSVAAATTPFAFGAFAPFGATNTTFVNGAFTPGWSAWFTPALTANALMFNNLAVLNSFTPYTFNITFQAQSAAQSAAVSTAAAMNAGALSVFATPILPGAIATAAVPIPFMSMAWPVLAMPVLPAIAAPAIAAPLAAPLL